jgi:hypothetical protein
MGATTTLTFRDVHDTFARLYGELREANGNAPNSYTWFAPTLADLKHECSVMDQDAEEPGGRLGTGEPVAWVYECEGRSLTAIGADATSADVEAFLRECMFADDEPDYA